MLFQSRLKMYHRDPLSRSALHGEIRGSVRHLHPSACTLMTHYCVHLCEKMQVEHGPGIMLDSNSLTLAICFKSSLAYLSDIS